LYGDNEFFALVKRANNSSPHDHYVFPLSNFHTTCFVGALHIIIIISQTCWNGELGAAKVMAVVVARKQPYSPLTRRIIMFLINVSHTCARARGRKNDKKERRPVTGGLEEEKINVKELRSTPRRLQRCAAYAIPFENPSAFLPFILIWVLFSHRIFSI
jgi:hypothetical protein